MTSSGTSSTRRTSTKEGLGKNSRRREDLGSEKLMLEGLLNYRLHGTTLPYEEILIALENIIDKVTTQSEPKVKKIDSSVTREIGMAAGTDGEEAFEEGYGKASGLAAPSSVQGNRRQRWIERRKGSQLERTEETSTA